MQSKRYLTIEEIKRKMERYCVYQDRCHKEVEKKLNENTSLLPESKNHILLHLLEHDFLNEERFAKSFARGKFRIKKWGRKRIVRELKWKDISSYNIKIALREIDNTEYENTLQSLIQKKNETIVEQNILKRKKKIIDFLLYKGYELDLIYEKVNKQIE